MNILSPQLQIDFQTILVRIQFTISGCCDFIAQIILVRTKHFSYHPFYSPKTSKDLQMLDCVEQKYPCRDHPFIPGNHLHRSVNISINFEIGLPSKGSSYMASDRRLRYGMGFRPNF